MQKIDYINCPNYPFKFIDLFSGIGGFRLAMESLGGECVFSSEIDENARKTYIHNFNDKPYGDITLQSTKDMIPEEFDVLCAGFPCQAFSIAGKRLGFEDTRGTLFFDVADIIRKHHPQVVFLENVKNLITHDDGKTFTVIKSTLEELGYIVKYKVMNASEYANIPQNRERVFIVAFNKILMHTELCDKFKFPDKIDLTNTISDCIDYATDDDKLIYTEKFPHYDELRKSITSTDTIYQWRRKYVRDNKSNLCPTLTANMGTGGHNVPLILTTNNVIRKLSPKECLNFQGFPKSFTFPDNISNSAKYKQAGNSVVVPLITAIGQNIVELLRSQHLYYFQK